MGTDIHAAIEYRREKNGRWHAVMHKNRYFGKWEGESEFSAGLDINRSYDTFSILANVRNGYGFAGVVTGEGFKYISDCRGTPGDISEEALEAMTGDHSPTWVTARELLEFDWTQTTGKQGWVTAACYAQWKRHHDGSDPHDWCGGVHGRNVVHLSNEEMDTYIAPWLTPDFWLGVQALKEDIKASNTYTLVSWNVTYMEAAKNFWIDHMPPIMKLAAEHGPDNVRLVMNFDS